MQIQYRTHTSDDLPKLRQLWTEFSNWGTISDEDWQRYVIEAPNGGPFICVAMDPSDRIVGAMTFMRLRMMLNGREVKAVRPFAPIVSDVLRKHMLSLNPLDHPVVRMSKHMESLLREEGFVLTFMLPDPHWKLLFRLMPRVSLSSYPLWSIRLPLPQPLAHQAGYTSEPFNDWGEPVDTLWARVSTDFGSGVVRDSARLHRHSGPPHFDVLGIRRGGELVGLVCSRKHGDRQWLICDMIATDEAARREALIAACNLAHTKAVSNEDGEIIKAALLVTPPLLPLVQDLGFQRDKYDFTLAVRRLGDTITKDDLEGARWYLSAND